jgi:hypothetical protein
MNRFFVRAHWSARKEDRQECAERIGVFLNGLTTLRRELSTFYKGQWTRKTLLRQLPVMADDLMPFLGQTYTSFAPRELMPELGYRLVAWNGLPDESRVAKLHIHCGAYSARVGNGVTLSFNSVEESDVLVLRHLIETAISAFDPEEAVAKWQPNDAKLSDLDYFSYDRKKGLRSNLS